MGSSIFRTPAPYGVSAATHPNGIDAQSLQHYMVGDERGRLVIVAAPDVAPPEQQVSETIVQHLTDAGAGVYNQLAALGAFSVTIRNPSNKYIRVAKSLAPGVNYITIAPKFARTFLCKNANEWFVVRDDLLAGAIRLEVTRRSFAP